MPQNERTYIAIDLKSYYASVECMERGLDPMQTNLVVADPSRTEKTICLAVSPALKAYGIPGRARLFEVVERVRQVNAERQRRAPGGRLTGKSADGLALKADASLAVDYLVAPPRMAKYIEVSMQIYGIYLKYISPEDIHTYSIDEVLMDVTGYLETYRMTARELARAMILDVLHTTGITATAGIGSNLYLCKVAMDMMAKRVPPDENGVRIAQLDERSYRALLWEHRPLTDFWRVGRGYAKKLEEHGLYTMGDVARCSIGKPNEYYNEGLLYKLFGVNAELLIDHAWGWEPCRMADIKAYRPETNSISSGQVLQCPYPYDKARLVVREMAEAVALELLEKRIVTDQLTLTVGYDIENTASGSYRGETVLDPYGRKIPKHAHGTATLGQKTSSVRRIVDAVLGVYDEKADPKLTVRRLTVTANRLMREEEALRDPEPPVQFSLLTIPRRGSGSFGRRKPSRSGSAGSRRPCWASRKSTVKMPSSAAAATLTGRPHASGTARSEDTRHERKIRRYHRPAASRAADASADAHARPRGAVRALCGAHRSPRRPCGDGAPRRRRGGAGERAGLGAVACGAELVFRDGVCLGGAAAIQAPSRPDKTSGDEAAIRPPRLFFVRSPARRSSRTAKRQTPQFGKRSGGKAT